MDSQRTRVKPAGGVLECCARARAFEHIGEFELARQELALVWPRVGERPPLDGLNERQTAEVLLRVGCLTGWLGSSRQLEGSQDLALDLLSESARAFELVGDGEKYAEAQNGIAFVYWRKAAFDEARICLRALLDRADTGKEQPLWSIVILTMVERSSGNTEAALRLHAEAASLFGGDDVPARLKATFHNGWALSHRKAGNTDEALLRYAAATKYLEEAGDSAKLAIVERNLGFLFYTIKRYEDALQHLNRSLELDERRSDRRGTAEAQETLSRVLLETGDLEGAERASRFAARTFREGEEKALLVEALTSHGTALARLGRRREALMTFLEAEEEAGNYIGRKEASAVVERLIEEIVAPLCLETGLPLEDPVNLLEKAMLKGALVTANKSMKEAALRLGVEYDTLRYIIRERHPELRGERSPVTPRRRSIIKKGERNVKKLTEVRKES